MCASESVFCHCSCVCTCLLILHWCLTLFFCSGQICLHIVWTKSLFSLVCDIRVAVGCVSWEDQLWRQFLWTLWDKSTNQLQSACQWSLWNSFFSAQIWLFVQGRKVSAKFSIPEFLCVWLLLVFSLVFVIYCYKQVNIFLCSGEALSVFKSNISQLYKLCCSWWMCMFICFYHRHIMILDMKHEAWTHWSDIKSRKVRGKIWAKGAYCVSWVSDPNFGTFVWFKFWCFSALQYNCSTLLPLHLTGPNAMWLPDHSWFSCFSQLESGKHASVFFFFFSPNTDKQTILFWSHTSVHSNFLPVPFD